MSSPHQPPQNPAQLFGKKRGEFTHSTTPEELAQSFSLLLRRISLIIRSFEENPPPLPCCSEDVGEEGGEAGEEGREKEEEKEGEKGEKEREKECEKGEESDELDRFCCGLDYNTPFLLQDGPMYLFFALSLFLFLSLFLSFSLSLSLSLSLMFLLQVWSCGDANGSFCSPSYDP